MSDTPSRPPSRCRSIPYRPPYFMAVFWTILHIGCVLATITLLAFFFIDREAGNGNLYKRPIVAVSSCAILTLIISYYKRRAARCPLCMGTPLMNSGALTHKRSRRFGPFNEGFTSVLGIAFTQRFRCMYCGTRYDLLKTPRRKKLLQDESDE